MGNTTCTGSGPGLEDLCTGRCSPNFFAPNYEHVTYDFDYKRGKDLQLANGQPSGALTPQGLALESPGGGGRRAPRWYTVKEYPTGPAQHRLCVSGRVLVEFPEKPSSNTSQGGVCAFRICTRGHPVCDSVRTKNFTHTAQVITSGVFFCLYIVCTAGNFHLCPKIVVVLEGGDEVVMVHDLLGPLRSPQSFYADFAIADDGGRNVQIDLIFRGKADDAHDKHSMRTLRTCLQDYTTFNNEVNPASICLGYANLLSHLPQSSVHLQNLVVSEERFEDQIAVPLPFDFRKAQVSEAEGPAVLFEGEDARAAAEKVELPEAHPQLQVPKSPRFQEDAAPSDDFWYHIRYDRPKGGPDPDSSEFISPLKGEFWLSKETLDKKGVYFRCSSTLAQALTMCVAFRFSCPTEFISFIETKAVCVLRDAHIPTNGVVLGIEQDPRHKEMLRMFIEHRNEIMDDMVVCECQDRTRNVEHQELGPAGRCQDRSRSVVHQEIYDGGGSIYYRLTLVHRDGSRQSAAMQMATDILEDQTNLDRGVGQYQNLVEDPSPRFPISPCLMRYNLSPANRVFVYTGVSYDRPEELPGDCESFDSGCDGYATPNIGGRSVGESSVGACSEATAEDWQSAGGCDSDREEALLRATSAQLEDGGEVVWRRPLVESIVLLNRVEEPPFKVLPMSLS